MDASKEGNSSLQKLLKAWDQQGEQGAGSAVAFATLCCAGFGAMSRSGTLCSGGACPHYSRFDNPVRDMEDHTCTLPAVLTPIVLLHVDLLGQARVLQFQSIQWAQVLLSMHLQRVWLDPGAFPDLPSVPNWNLAALVMPCVRKWPEEEVSQLLLTVYAADFSGWIPAGAWLRSIDQDRIAARAVLFLSWSSGKGGACLH